jgi:hypothetical protein
MRTTVFIPVALAGLLIAGCEEKPQPGAQSAPSPALTPDPSPSVAAARESAPPPSPSTTAAPESNSSPPAPAPLKSPEETTPPPAQSSPSAAAGDARPIFSSQSANEYVQSYDAYVNDFKVAYQAMKQGDMTKYQAVIQRAHELESKGEKLGGELSPEEQTRFADYLNRKANELAQFAGQTR